MRTAPEFAVSECGSHSLRPVWLSGRSGILEYQCDQFEGQTFIMKISSIVARQRVAGISAGCLLGGIAMGIAAAPSAVAAPDCSPGGVDATVSSVRGAAEQYLAAHPGANQAVSAAYGQPRGDAASNIRGYFTSHPNEYYELRGILAPIGETERQCGVTALPPNLESAYHEFMAG
jgi:hemophore-related protein